MIFNNKTTPQLDEKETGEIHTIQSSSLYKCILRNKRKCIISTLLIILAITIWTAALLTKKETGKETSLAISDISTTITAMTTEAAVTTELLTTTISAVITTTKASVTSITIKVSFPGRSDFTSELRPTVGLRGDFMGYAYCPANTWAYGFQQRVEPPQGGNDDSALNAVRLFCRGKNVADSYTISSYDGLWGDWGDSVSCNTTNNDFIYYAMFRIELALGINDYSSANDFRSRCWNGTTNSSGYLQAANGGQWGFWLLGAACKSGSAICGINTRFEAYQGPTADDTAMNGAFFGCCSL
ncbi:unnamed protein product [Adineta ricciae]|uniref:Vitelline membrane outer layer 1-like protein n=1 Tax=Adineta ricciae TaxID=249248 RepID=A0A816DQ78_ADIRI|nr:unnamed protein product [Adineta ricciae]CAF1640044.1 unnamed protein product [Adineta ricciae]